MPDKQADPGKRAHSHEVPGALAFVEEALRGLRFGEVTIIVHDGQIVQVERTEKRRFDNNS
jgi:hypothetical protein